MPVMSSSKTPDVVVLGEVLVELTAPVPLREAETLRLSCSGDALNAAAAAAEAGASVALLTAVGDDELGDRILSFIAARGIDTTWITRRPEPNGVYFAGADGEFVYVRRGSAASTIGPRDVSEAPVAEAGAVIVSGITQALSDSCAAAVDAAVAAAGGHVIYDPNFRRRLTTAQAARAALERVAPHAALVTPSCPDDTEALLGTTDPAAAAAALRSLGAGGGRGHDRRVRPATRRRRRGADAPARADLARGRHDRRGRRAGRHRRRAAGARRRPAGGASARHERRRSLTRRSGRHRLAPGLGDDQVEPVRVADQVDGDDLVGLRREPVDDLRLLVDQPHQRGGAVEQRAGGTAGPP